MSLHFFLFSPETRFSSDLAQNLKKPAPSHPGRRFWMEWDYISRRSRVTAASQGVSRLPRIPPQLSRRIRGPSCAPLLTCQAAPHSWASSEVSGRLRPAESTGHGVNSACGTFVVGGQSQYPHWLNNQDPRMQDGGPSISMKLLIQRICQKSMPP